MVGFQEGRLPLCLFAIGTFITLLFLLLVWKFPKKSLLYAYLFSFVVTYVITSIVVLLSSEGGRVNSDEAIGLLMCTIFTGVPFFITLAIFFVKVKGKSVYSLLW